MSDGWPVCACGNVLSPDNVELVVLSGVAEALCSNVSCALRRVARAEPRVRVVRFLVGFNELLFGSDDGFRRIKRLEETLQSRLARLGWVQFRG
ncbi:MAG: hypothetical protein NZ953_01185 [Thaumarchaeota archaeon]|nr:hypothetical protein [Candidatus Calditenuaceae archaeon]MDW8043118.1 hypothetical protein [Nitrososphaerota archaeon]